MTDKPLYADYLEDIVDSGEQAGLGENAGPAD